MVSGATAIERTKQNRQQKPDQQGESEKSGKNREASEGFPHGNDDRNSDLAARVFRFTLTDRTYVCVVRRCLATTDRLISGVREELSTRRCSNILSCSVGVGCDFTLTSTDSG